MSKEAQINKEQQKKILVYVPFVGWIFAVMYLLTETDHSVRWHAIQSLILNGILMAILFVAVPTMVATGIFGPLGSVLRSLTSLVVVILNLWMMIKINEGGEPKLTVISEWTDILAKRK